MGSQGVKVFISSPVLPTRPGQIRHVYFESNRGAPCAVCGENPVSKIAVLTCIYWIANRRLQQASPPEQGRLHTESTTLCSFTHTEKKRMPGRLVSHAPDFTLTCAWSFFLDFLRVFYIAVGLLRVQPFLFITSQQKEIYDSRG